MPPTERIRSISNIMRIRIVILIAVMCSIEIILVMLKLYSCFGTLNWGVVFIPLYLILAVYHIGFHMCLNWFALVAIIITFTMTLNRDRGKKVGDCLIFLFIMESIMLYIEYRVIWPSRSEMARGTVLVTAFSL